jgi:hypothetical protein
MGELIKLWLVFAGVSGVLIAVGYCAQLICAKVFTKPVPGMRAQALKANAAVFVVNQLLLAVTFVVMSVVSRSRLDRDVGIWLIFLTPAIGLVGCGIGMSMFYWRKLDWPMWLCVACGFVAVACASVAWALIILIAIAIASIPQF